MRLREVRVVRIHLLQLRSITVGDYGRLLRHLTVFQYQISRKIAEVRGPHTKGEHTVRYVSLSGCHSVLLCYLLHQVWHCPSMATICWQLREILRKRLPFRFRRALSRF